MPLPDEEVMARCSEGDEAAFEELLGRYRKPMLNFFYRLVWDRSTAEDCAQEVFCRLYARTPAAKERLSSFCTVYPRWPA